MCCHVTCYITADISSFYFRFWGPVYTGLAMVLLAFMYMLYHTRKAMSQFQGPRDPFAIQHRV